MIMNDSDIISTYLFSKENGDVCFLDSLGLYGYSVA